MAKPAGPFKFINMISSTKEMPEFDDEFEKHYSPFLTTKFFSQHDNNACLIANELNVGFSTSKKAHFLFLYHLIRKAKRFGWMKPEKDEKIQFIMEVYNFNYKKATEAADLLSDEQIKKLKEVYCATGGVTSKKKTKNKKNGKDTK